MTKQSLLILLSEFITFLLCVVGSIIATKRNLRLHLKQTSPKLNTFLLDNESLSKLYLEDIQSNKYIYLLQATPKRVQEERKKAEIAFDIDFIKIESEQCIDLLKNNKLFAMCFRNENANTTLSIDRIKGHDENIYSIANMTHLDALINGTSVCILCDIEHRPLSFHGRYENCRVMYPVNDLATSFVMPVVEKISSY